MLCSAKLCIVTLAIAGLSSLAMGAGPRGAREVLIYYANETAAEGDELNNYQTVLQWLRSCDDARCVHIVQQLERDLRSFTVAVDAEERALCGLARDEQTGTDVVVFTNRLTRMGKCRIWNRGSSAPEDVSFAIARCGNFVLDSNPLAVPDTLRSALALVAQRFAPAQHRFVLITKSHGTRVYAFVPRLSIRAAETDRESLLNLATHQAVQNPTPVWAAQVGTTKANYLAILEQAGRQHGMRFSLVYLEACKAFTDEMNRLPSNVAGLLLVRDKPDYTNLDYREVLKKTATGQRCSDAMLTGLSDSFVVIQTHEALAESPHGDSWDLRRSVYVMPLGGWLVYLLWNSGRSRQGCERSLPSKTFDREPVSFAAL